MYTLEKCYGFEAGHRLVHHNGKCRHPHGHSYLLRVCLQSDQLQQSGPMKNMVLDFYEIDAIIKPMIQEFLDHKWLNDTLETDSPTAEAIAKWVFSYLKPNLPSLVSVSIEETRSSKATYCA